MKIEWKTCFRVCASMFLLYLCILYWKSAVDLAGAFFGAATPLLIGCGIAYLINILMDFYEGHYFIKSGSEAVRKSRRPVCMAAAFITLAGIIVLVIGLVVPQLSSCVQLIFSALPDAIKSLVGVMEKLDILPGSVTDALSGVDWQSKIEHIIRALASGFGNVMDMVVGALASVFSGIVTALMAVIFSIYLLADKEKLGRQFDRVLGCYMKKSWYDRTMHVLGVLNDCFHHYIVGQCTEAVILGLLCTAGMFLLRLPYAAMTGALISFTALIPVAGAYIGAGVGAFMILTVSPVKAVVFLVFIVVLQQLEGNLIYPRVVGSSMGLPAIWVLAAVTVGGGIMGIAGMLLGVPVAAAVYRLLREDVRKKTACNFRKQGL